ncbi:MAG: YqaE/Pmp3 family membrane protein [Bacteroidota bacterium]|nr:YqaE/Pmp3 family membrane protein [Bacteroidota bacterium]
MILLAILFPWLSFFVRGKILAGFVCLILQITLIGWIPAMIWAVVSRNNEVNENRLKEMEQRIMSGQRGSSQF